MNKQRNCAAAIHVGLCASCGASKMLTSVCTRPYKNNKCEEQSYLSCNMTLHVNNTPDTNG